MPASPPPLIKPLLQGVETWRGLHNALQCAGMGQSQWTAGSEKDRQRKSRRERHLRHLRLSPFHLQPDSYFLKLSTRWRLCDYSLPLRLSLLHSLFHTLLHTHTLSLGLSLAFSGGLTKCAFKCLWKTQAPNPPVLNTGISKNHSSKRRHLVICSHISQENQSQWARMLRVDAWTWSGMPQMSATVLPNQTITVICHNPHCYFLELKQTHVKRSKLSVWASKVMSGIHWQTIFTNVIKRGEKTWWKKCVVVRGNTGMCLYLRQHSSDLRRADAPCTYTVF